MSTFSEVVNFFEDYNKNNHIQFIRNKDKTHRHVH